VSDVDFEFAWEGASGPAGPWSHLRVVEFRGTEGISSLYRYEIIVFARDPAPEVDPDDLIQTKATLRIATHTEPAFRVVHGLIVEAEELGPAHGGVLYRLVLAPPLVRTMHRTRCRIFLEKTTREIITAVLQGDPELSRSDGAVVEPPSGDALAFTPAKELFAFRVTNTPRIDEVAARPYCVQYNETDFAFVSRLLEEEGISYHFENGEGTCLLVLSDQDAGRTRLDPFAPLGGDILNRTVASMKLGARLRPRKVSLHDYNWKKPALGMAVEEGGRAAGGELVDHEYPGRYPDTPDQGKPLAMAKLDRLKIEASYAVGEGSCRLLAAGSIFALDDARPRYEGEYLVTKVDVRGEQQGVLPPIAGGRFAASGVPYASSFECARRGKNGSVEESRFRPARVTPKPRVAGTQTAFVTAEPKTQGTEIHVGGPPGAEIGCVRVKFHWDQETSRHAKEPTSCWVRVSQVFAGVGEGAVFHPRVGVEVIVDYEEGDPDRPIVVGRVYNGQNRPPGGAPTVSTFKTMTSPGGGTYNELTFDDTAGNQQIKLHTPKNWNSEVGNDRTEQVTSNSSSSVGVDRSETTGSNRTTMVGANNSEVVGANESLTVGANQNIAIGANQGVTIGSNQSVTIGSNQSVEIGADQSLKVGGNQDEAVAGNRKVDIAGNDELAVAGTQKVTVTGAQTTTLQATHDLSVTANQTIAVGGVQSTTVTGPQEMTSATLQKLEAPMQTLIAAALQTLQSTILNANASATATLQTALMTLIGSGMIKMEAGQLVITAGPISITGGEITITGGDVKIAAGSVGVSGGKVDVVGGLVKLN
jgi:type VI secretion system secreted protein VgrG